ncbi:MAG: transglycosylase family protein [Solirubrobacterales bacterium]
MLTKRTYFVLLAVVALAFPVAAFASSGSDSGADRGPSVAPARAVLAPLQRSIDSFQRLVHGAGQRIERELRAERKRQRRQRFADLPGGVSIEALESIAACESGGDPRIVSSDGSYRGKYQFDFGTWESVGGHGDPAAAPEDEQDYRAALLYSRSGSSPWPVCG